MKNLLLLAGLLSAVQLAHGQVTNLFSSAGDLVGIDNRLESDGSTYVVASADGNAFFGNQDALRIADLTATDKPEAVWNAPAITAGFRLDMRAANNAFVDGSPVDINLRFADSADTVTSSANVMTTISFEADSKLKIEGSTVFTFTPGVAAAISLVFNVSTTDVLNFTLNEAAHALAASNIMTFVDGVLVDTRAMVAGDNFDPTSGVAKIGFVGESDSKLGVDYLFDDITLFVGDDISVPISAVPEPSSFALVFGIAALGFASRRRRVAA